MPVYLANFVGTNGRIHSKPIEAADEKAALKAAEKECADDHRTVAGVVLMPEMNKNEE